MLLTALKHKKMKKKMKNLRNSKEQSTFCNTGVAKAETGLSCELCPHLAARQRFPQPAFPLLEACTRSAPVPVHAGQSLL